MESCPKTSIRLFLAVALVIAADLFSPARPIAAASPMEVRSSFLHLLSDFGGAIPYHQGKIYSDRKYNEVYVYDGNSVRVFNAFGMEIFRFAEYQALGSISSITTDEGGDIYTLSNFPPQENQPDLPVYCLIRCNYRGDEKERIPITGQLPEFSGFEPESMIYRDGRFFLVSLTTMKGIVTDKRGVFKRGFDFGAMVAEEEKDRADIEFSGFTLDEEGNFYFTAPVLFKVFKFSPEGKKMGAFGKPGGAPGFFGVVSGVAVDQRGTILVSDKLKSVVMVFDRNFQFLTQFGGRGNRPDSLTGPVDLVLDNSGKVYVTQLRKRGVSVFSLNYN